MDMELLHPDSAEFPEHDIDWKTAEVFPIGVVQIDDDGDYYPLAIAQQGRLRALFAMVDGAPVKLDPEEAGLAFYAALDDACSDTWGHSWNSAVTEIFNLNRRTVQRDRIEKYLLPPKVCMTLAYIFSADDRQPLADLLIAINRYRQWEGTAGRRDLVERYVSSGIRLIYEEDELATMGLFASEDDAPAPRI